jgi:hypothetical protein
VETASLRSRRGGSLPVDRAADRSKAAIENNLARFGKGPKQIVSVDLDKAADFRLEQHALIDQSIEVARSKLA